MDLLRSSIEQHRQAFLSLALQGQIVLRLVYGEDLSDSDYPLIAPDNLERRQFGTIGRSILCVFASSPQLCTGWIQQAVSMSLLLPEIPTAEYCRDGWISWATTLINLCWAGKSGLPRAPRLYWRSDQECTATVPADQLGMLQEQLRKSGQGHFGEMRTDRWFATIENAAQVSAQACLVLVNDLPRSEESNGNQTKRTKAKPKRKGRPPDTDPDADQAIVDEWKRERKCNPTLTYEQFAQAKGRSLGVSKGADVENAIDRERKRIKKARPQPPKRAGKKRSKKS